MDRSGTPRLALLSALAACALLWPTPASAQRGPRDAQTEAVIRQAMDDYQNLDIPRAVNRLQAALRACGARLCSSGIRARVHMSLGIVRVMGLSDAAAGTEAMVLALQLDAAALPDPQFVTPEINDAFRQARERVPAAAASANANPPPAASAPTSAPDPFAATAPSTSTSPLATPTSVELPGTAPAEPAALPTSAPAAPEASAPPAPTPPRAPRPPSRGGLGDPCTSTDCDPGLRCDRGSCSASAPEPAGPELPPEPERHTRVSIDVGGGLGVAVLSGQPAYAERRQGPEPGTITCAPYVCFTNIETGLAPTYFLTATVRWNPTRRVGFAVGGRVQFDAADNSVRAQTLANLLLHARAYLALTPRGFAPTGSTLAVFAGGGFGQIQPRPLAPVGDTRETAHILSGLHNVNAGVRVEQSFRNGFHIAAELTFHVMFPDVLFDTDLAAMAGFHF